MYEKIKLVRSEIVPKVKRIIGNYEKQLFLFKYVVTFISIGIAFITSKSIEQVVVSTIELLSIIILSNIIGKRNRLYAYIFNSVTVLIILLEQFFMYFGGTYLSMIMLSNVGSLQALSNKLPLYIICIIIVISISLLPIIVYDVERDTQLLMFLLLFVGEITYFNLHKDMTSPFYNIYVLAKEKKEYDEIKARLAKEGTANLSKFYNEEVKDYRKKAGLSAKPNVILIFVEGLSQTIIDDKKNLLPNVKSLQEKSINFTNYYNHTFATYRGIIGQLYSGYQFDNYEINKLVSIQEVLSNNGYETNFINTEPHNELFTEYLNNLEFDKVTTLSKAKEEVSDKQAFELLFQTVSDRKKIEKPFFLSIYTFGTHIALDSQDEKYGSGSKPILNRFKNFDIQFGNFVKKMNEVGGFDNTILVFTTDHATYVDEEYVENFPSRSYGSLDRVPFFIYHTGINPETIDVNGRNSLALAPTILDFIDISEKNYFIGTSLFSKTTFEELETIYSSELNYLTSKDNIINFLNDKKKNEVSQMIEDYYSAKLFGVR
ncbi:sulfatase-like hydrolase/transferase [Streptococcus suis]|uniref:Phosphoglycerol transferase I n=2 Tax=Streptococcus suis TaxID=1307 RepID=A0A116RG89_STRSU|nr:sulfatase-like hydrolase/transferase [Streptococcus suis]MBY4962867.1 sulfatase-like hydrolase/transferase [Streptococcus suis]MBY4968919.1 sulfatase-like hydrolase/transferase [Streptococcus suis]MBY4980288.1 sulfatase-like hydrolase/transferase [Streptococcus suis]MBY4988860.1 sulfatase-like hydrolase/transferase [Streptococcus suis]MBY4995083.1 sulfatase-like hydrolase/transferase [Streptococcus suis]